MRLFNKRYTRIISLLLAIALLISAIPTIVFATGISEIKEELERIAISKDVANIVIMHGDAEISSLVLAENGKETLTAKVNDVRYSSRCWQMRIPGTTEWVSISDKTGESIDVTYALVGSLLDEAGRAYLRHVVKDGDAVYTSAPVEIVMSYNTPESEAMSDSAATFNLMRAATGARAAEDGNGGNTDFQLISIVINYLFDNGDIAFEPYGATIAKGSDFTAKIESPSVMGYEPFRRIGVDYVDATFVEFDLTDVQENVTINVIYEPALVEFQVHHHLQGINDDEYSLSPDYITKSVGLTGSKVPDKLTIDIPGFKPLAYEKDIVIAADGSTVVEIRYDRNYYLVSFEMAGGYGTDPVYARYETTIGVNPPIRHGYLFMGWELISYADSVPSDAQKSEFDINGVGKTIKLPAANLKYLAKWKTELTTYTMVFWKENINDNGFTYWGYLDDISAMSGSLVSADDRVDEVSDITDEKYFTYCEAISDKDVIVEGDGSTVVNVYYTRNRYTITFKAKGKCTIEENHTHTKDECYVTVCDTSHVHDESCNPTLDCNVTEHTEHTDACIGCGIQEHVHTDSCYCGVEEHTHTKDCWKNVGDAVNTPNNAPRNPKDGQIYRVRSGIRYNYYIYIFGSWYTYNGTASNNTIVDRSCGYTTEHTHTDACAKCGFETEHTHGDDCYSDVLHTHGNGCYSYSCGTKEHIHTDGCYVLNCGTPTGHTHNNTCKSATQNNTVKLVYAKYEENLEHIWPVVDDNGVVYDEGQRWTPSSSDYYSQVLVFIANMPPDDFTLTLSTSDASPYTMNYYLEVLPGDAYTHTYEGRNYALYTTIKASYNYVTKAEDFFDIQGFDQLTSNPKFSGDQIKISSGNKTVNFYYSRKTDNNLEFSNNGNVIYDKTVSGVMYGAPLSQYNFVPEYPTNLEEGAFVFGGWYTSPGCYDGTEVDWSTLTMEAGDMLLYARWDPIVHTIEIYTEYKDGEYLGKLGETQHVSHNSFAGQPSVMPEKGNYVFHGWFYIDEDTGEEKAFVFTGIPVNQDMKIYAKWSSDVSVRYKIYYVLEKDGTTIADPLEGVGLAGHNKTFNAKVNNELYEGYRIGYYPLTSSHTVTMSAEVELHEFTFKYKYVESVPYEVRYVDQNGKEVRKAKEVFDNNLSVVTETFEKVDKMMPDAYQKRLVLSADGEDKDNNGILDNNVITFVYEQDETHAYYKVIHYIRNIADDGYREYRSEETKGVIGTVYTITPITLSGFKFNNKTALVNGAPATVNSDNTVKAQLGEDGMLIELYYDRVEVQYTVNYLESGTNAVLHEPKIDYGLYGGQVVEFAIGLTMNGYTLESDEVKQLNLSFDETHNVINFYYKESTYAIKYEIAGATDGGTLTQFSENVKAITTETAIGSSPIVYKGYKFVGWFEDAACSVAVPSDWVDSANKITPQKSGNAWLSSKTYYAKIEPNVTSMTISTMGAMEIDEGQVFIFHIKGKSDAVKHVELDVVIVGNGSVTVTDLVVGEYTVSEITDWSFRYSVVNAEKTISLTVDPDKNTVDFGEVRSFTGWLDGNHILKNIFSK